MRRLLSLVLVASVVVVIPAGSVGASSHLVTWQLDGTVTSVSASGICPTVLVGDGFQATYTFDPATPDLNLGDALVGHYALDSGTLTLGANTFALVGIEVLDNGVFGLGDAYSLLGAGPGPFGSTVPEFAMGGPTSVFASDALPSAPPNPADFGSVGSVQYVNAVPGCHAQIAVANHIVISEMSPEEQIAEVEADIDDLVESGELKKGQANGLLKPLQNALRSLDKGKTEAACNQLQDFLDEVNQKVADGALDPDSGADLIAAAEAIRADVGCT